MALTWMMKAAIFLLLFALTHASLALLYPFTLRRFSLAAALYATGTVVMYGGSGPYGSQTTIAADQRHLTGRARARPTDETADLIGVPGVA